MSNFKLLTLALSISIEAFGSSSNTHMLEVASNPSTNSSGHTTAAASSISSLTSTGQKSMLEFFKVEPKIQKPVEVATLSIPNSSSTQGNLIPSNQNTPDLSKKRKFNKFRADVIPSATQTMPEMQNNYNERNRDKLYPFSQLTEDEKLYIMNNSISHYTVCRDGILRITIITDQIRKQEKKRQKENWGEISQNLKRVQVTSIPGFVCASS